MRFPPRDLGWTWLFAFLFIFAAQALVPIFQNSPTADEPGDLTSGYFYWQGDVLSDKAHPPLAKGLQALPLRFMGLNHHLDPWVSDYLARAYDFFFVLNRSRFETMLWAGRLVSLLLGLGVGVLLFFATRKSLPMERFAVMTLFTFEPTLLAFSGLSVADGPVTFFFLAAVLAFQKHLKSPGTKWSLTAGSLTALAVGCKFSALALLPIFALLEFFPSKDLKRRRWNPKDWAWGTLTFLAVIALLYLPGTLFLPRHTMPWIYFLAGLWTMIGQTHAFHATYFLGLASHQNHWLYYPLAFFLKSTLPFILLVGLEIGLGLARKISTPAWVWIPALLFFLLILPTPNLGVRYLLPAYPFLILLAGQAAGWLWNWGPTNAPRAGKILTAALLLWHLGTALLNEGRFLSYFNDLISENNKIHFLGDSNLDWGQGEKKLAQAARREGWSQIKLAQVGGVDLSLYGLKTKGWTQKDLAGPQPGFVYLVNTGFLQLGPLFYPPLEPLAKSWIRVMPPTGRIGDTWFYWKIPGTPLPDPSKPLGSVQTSAVRYQKLNPLKNY